MEGGQSTVRIYTTMISNEVLDLCDDENLINISRFDPEGARQYR